MFIVNYPYPPVEAQTSAPLSNKIWTHSGFLWRAAKCSGVAPLPSLILTNLAYPLNISKQTSFTNQLQENKQIDSSISNEVLSVCFEKFTRMQQQGWTEQWKEWLEDNQNGHSKPHSASKSVHLANQTSISGNQTSISSQRFINKNLLLKIRKDLTYICPCLDEHLQTGDLPMHCSQH